ncbi:hypothetical protein ACPC5U_13020 [Acinetobacter haemolyticus]|uniref:hypothetical protein n=1 Tax=Acinetobacter haemolyticus TaxID=29430 RepID=UPI003C1CFE06
MNEYTKMLHEIESKKADLEQRISKLIGEEIANWQAENQLAVQSIYVDLISEHSLGSAKKYIVTGVSIDLDYKP